ncbi:hypothetical protein ACFL3V_00675 [Nanoarchaeota archaeon]
MPLLRLGKNNKNELEKRFTTFSEQLIHAFAQIKTDISEVHHKLESNQTEMGRMYQWIEYLNRHTQRIAEHNSKISQKAQKITENHLKLHNSHQELHSEHENTAKIAKTIENSHQRLSEDISTNKQKLKSEVMDQLRQHKQASSEDLERLKAWIDYFSVHIDRQKGKEDDLRQDLSRAEKSWLESYSTLRELLNGLKSENGELKESVSEVYSELETTRNELKMAISELESVTGDITGTKTAIDELREDLEKTRKNTENLAQNQKFQPKSESSEQLIVAPPQANQPISTVQPPVQHINQVQMPPQTTFQRHIMSRVLPNRKGYVLKFIIQLISEGKYSTKELEEAIVNEKQLCGRTSFYAYIKELKLKGRIGYAEIDERTILVNTDTQQSIQRSISDLDNRMD